MKEFSEKLRGTWLGQPIGLGYVEKIENEKEPLYKRIIIYMIIQDEQAVIEIKEPQQIRVLMLMPMAQIDESMADWLMNEELSKLKTFYTIEDYEIWFNKKYN